MLSNKQKESFSAWQIAKTLWLTQILASLFFGIPLTIMVLFAANIAVSVIQQITLFYFAISFFIYIPLNGILSLIFLNFAKKILTKTHEKEELVEEKQLDNIRKLLNLPLYFAVIVFFTSFSGFIFGLFILSRGIIPGLTILIEAVIILGLAVGFATCVIQVFLVYIILENYFQRRIEKLFSSYFKTTKIIKIRKIPFSWKIFFLTFFSVVVAQTSLGALYLGRAIIYSPEDVKDVLIYISIVIALTLVYVIIVTLFFSKNLVYPLKKIISWADKIIKGETKEAISLVTNDELLEVIAYLKQMHEELENAKASLEIKIKARTKELEEITEKQEEIIQERVREVQKRAEELERFQRLAVGRELKMVELKKEIKVLEERLNKFEK